MLYRISAVGVADLGRFLCSRESRQSVLSTWEVPLLYTIWTVFVVDLGGLLQRTSAVCIVDLERFLCFGASGQLVKSAWGGFFIVVEFVTKFYVSCANGRILSCLG